MRLTLNGVLSAAVIGLAALLGALFFLLYESSTTMVQQSAAELRRVARDRVGNDIDDYFWAGDAALNRLEKQLRAGSCPPAQAESCLMSALLGNPNFSEVTLTRGVHTGFNQNGRTILAEEGRSQVSVYRDVATGLVCTRQISGRNEKFVSRVACRPANAVLSEPTPMATSEVIDPTYPRSFGTPSRESLRGQTIWSDLSYAEDDERKPETQRRVEVLGLRAVETEDHQLLGTLRIALRAEEIKVLVDNVRPKPTPGSDAPAADPFKIFIADEKGRLITGMGPNDKLASFEDDVRIKTASLSPDIQAALNCGSLTALDADQSDSDGLFKLEGERFLVSYHLLGVRRLPDGTVARIGPQDWRVGVVGPEDYYLMKFQTARNRLVYSALAVLALLLFGGVLALRVIRRSLARIQTGSRQMSAFDFSPHPVDSRFADVRDTLFSLEQAKTAVRAMGKYVPLALVRRLFEENREPALGGALREVTIFFSDIEGFTSRAEDEPPDVVAQWLGQYLEVMTRAVHAEDGTVDKFIGDSVMALWNAPKANPDHAVLACQAALRCQEETKKLYASAQWKGRPPLVTRIGLHVDEVMVGHFGAPDRLSYTAIGDGVNLASRLEGLNKQYGTTLLVSEEVFARAKHRFAFRRIDHVAVKGKTHAIGVYELLGPVDSPGVVSEVIQRYEAGLASYVAGEFEKAQAVLVHNPHDAPSCALARRCAELVRNPPTEPWKGISFAQSK